MTKVFRADSRDATFELLVLLAKYFKAGALLAFSIETSPTGSARFSLVFADDFDVPDEIPGLPIESEDETR